MGLRVYLESALECGHAGMLMLSPWPALLLLIISRSSRCALGLGWLVGGLVREWVVVWVCMCVYLCVCMPCVCRVCAVFTPVLSLWPNTFSPTLTLGCVGGCVPWLLVSVLACVRAFVGACVRSCVRACVSGW